jgi:hypothetical protein
MGLIEELRLASLKVLAMWEGAVASWFFRIRKFQGSIFEFICPRDR